MEVQSSQMHLIQLLQTVLQQRGSHILFEQDIMVDCFITANLINQFQGFCKLPLATVELGLLKSFQWFSLIHEIEPWFQ